MSQTNEEKTFYNMYNHITDLILKVKRLESMMLDAYRRIDNLEDRIKDIEAHLKTHNEKITS